MNDPMTLAKEFNKRFTSMNGVDVPDRVVVSRDEWRALFAALTEQMHGRYWRDLESAPKDGTAIFAMLPDSTVPQSVRWSESAACWIVCWDHHTLLEMDIPQFWMPIP